VSNVIQKGFQGNSYKMQVIYRQKEFMSNYIHSALCEVLLEAFHIT